jgi:integrase
MARTLNRLSAKAVERLKGNGRYADGGGLYLQIRGDSRTWIFRYANRATGKEHELGLGPTHTIPLVRARELAQHNRAVLLAGNDPLEQRRRAAMASKLSQSRRMTFGDCATTYIAAHTPGWRNPKHAAQWTATIDTYCAAMKPLAVDAIDTAHVMRCLEPHWATKTETMARLRGRIERVLAWANAHKYRSGDNPARWRGHLDELLPKRSAVQKVEHRPALAYADMHDFMVALRQRAGLATRCLELQILTATRPGEAAGAQWSEFDLDAAMWTVPADRMKAGKEHRIPLSAPALALLKALPRAPKATHIFPGVKGRAITTAASMALLKELKPGITSHGFRSTFRDWAAETTAHPREVIEQAMAHRLKDKAEAAYQRGDMLTRRATLMRDWAAFCDRPAGSGNVTPIKGAKPRKASGASR